MSRWRVGAICLLAFAFSLPISAGFASNEVYLATIGRGGGADGAQFYSTLWVTNLSSSATVHFTFFFLKDGQSNLTGAPSFADTLAPGQTKLYEDVTEKKLNLPGLFGAARITADGEIFASERVYNLVHTTDNLGTSEGLFFAAVPKGFAIGSGEMASIQGVNQGSASEDMRTNFDLVETTGNTCRVHVTLLDQNGSSQGATDVNMPPYGHVKLNARALLNSISTINDRIVASVTSGSGKVILAGEQLGNSSQDSSGFEMSFRDSLLAGQGVTSVNGLTGDVLIAHGANTTVNVSGNKITIDTVAGAGSGLTSVAHDSTLTGNGTLGSVLGLTIPANLTGAASTGSDVFAFHNSTTGSSVGNTVHATADSPSLISSAVWGDNSDSGNGVLGTSKNGFGVHGVGSAGASVGVAGFGTGAVGVGVLASHTGSQAVGTALQIDNGTILVSGVNPTAFVVVASAENIGGNAVLIDNILINGDPNAMLIVTHNLNPPESSVTIHNPHPIGTYYAGGNWQIMNEDLAPMPIGASFNVLVIKR